MNAISSSVNKGAFKAAPKAGIRRPRRPDSSVTDSASHARPPSVSRESSIQEVAAEPSTTKDIAAAPARNDSTSQDISDAAPIPDNTSTQASIELPVAGRNLRSREQNSEVQNSQDLPVPSSFNGYIPFHEREPEPAPGLEPSPRPQSAGIKTRQKGQQNAEDHAANHAESATESASNAAQAAAEDLRLIQEAEEKGLENKDQKRATKRRRAREPTPETAELKVIDRSELRMADLCKDLRQGKKSDKYEKLEKIKSEHRRQRRLMNKQANAGLRDDQIKESTPQAEYEADALQQLKGSDVSEDEDDELAGEDNEDEEEQDLFLPDAGAPRTRVVNGEIVIDPTSLQVDRALRDAVDGPVELVEENPLERMVNSRTYSKRITSSRWSAEELQLFYDGLSQWGTDFDMISRMFPGRNRKQIKSKFTIEERRNPHLVTAALTNKKPVDLAEYSRMADVEYRTINQMETELADLKTRFESERAEAMKEAQQRKAEMDEVQAAAGTVEEPSRKKSRRREVNEGLEIVGDNEELEAEERRLAAERAAMDSDNE